MQTSILNIQNELDKARERLKGVEEHIKKSIGRDINTGPPIARFVLFSAFLCIFEVADGECKG